MAWNLDALVTFDPAQMGQATGNNILRNVCDPLVAFDLTDPAKIWPSWRICVAGWRC
jgi:peptide/nickel transport system substrate-binding protein